MDRLETMKAFVAVVQEGAFSKAADKLNLSPQVVSKYVSQLEQKLQIRLLNRTTRKVSLTEAGKKVPLLIFRDRKTIAIEVEVGDRSKFRPAE